MRKAYWALLLTAVACGGGSETTGPPARASLVGTWRANEVPGTIYRTVEIAITSDASTAANSGPLAGTYSYSHNCTTSSTGTCTLTGTLVNSMRQDDLAYISFSPNPTTCTNHHATLNATLTSPNTLNTRIQRNPCAGSATEPPTTFNLTRQ